jgi:PAS domain S-box-containing protein
MEKEPTQDLLTLEFGDAFAGVSGNLMVALLEQSQDCVKMMQIDGTLGFMNRNGRCNLEIDDFCDVAGKHWWDMWPDKSKPVVRQAVIAAAAGQESRFEAFCPTAKGTAKWWDVTVSPVRDDSGNIFQIVSFSRDVTEQVQAKLALETMAFEMRHRLRNAFTVSSAIAMVSAKDAPEHKQFASHLADRYAALALAQSQMLENSEKPLQLADMLEVLTAPYPPIEWQCPENLLINERNARVIALAVSELATNSLKYGALSQNSAVTLDSLVQGERLRVTWHEPQIVQPQQSAGGGGSGHLLIERMAKVYGGSFNLDWSASGLTASLELLA